MEKEKEKRNKVEESEEELEWAKKNSSVIDMESEDRGKADAKGSRSSGSRGDDGSRTPWPLCCKPSTVNQSLMMIVQA